MNGHLCLLCAYPRALAGLHWLKGWARANITRMKCRRKRLPRGAAFDPKEADLLRCLLDLESAIDRILLPHQVKNSVQLIP